MRARAGVILFGLCERLASWFEDWSSYAPEADREGSEGDVLVDFDTQLRG